MTETLDCPVPTGLPAGTLFHRVAFVLTPPDRAAVLAELPAALGHSAVAVGSGAPANGDELFVLAVPAEDDADLLARVRDWADPPAYGCDRTGQLVTLQGAHVVSTPNRVALVTAPDRLEPARRAVLEAAYYEAELSAVERELADLWPDLRADTPLAFEFAERNVRQRARLAERFVRVLGLRARLARITPHVLAPHAHPPTLASQLGERLRERGRMSHRVEALSAQIEVFERVYEGCGQKASEFMIARTGHTLEWVIIVLLLTQTVLVCVELFGGK